MLTNDHLNIDIYHCFNRILMSVPNNFNEKGMTNTNYFDLLYLINKMIDKEELQIFADETFGNIILFVYKIKMNNIENYSNMISKTIMKLINILDIQNKLPKIEITFQIYDLLLSILSNADLFEKINNDRIRLLTVYENKNINIDSYKNNYLSPSKLNSPKIHCEM